MSAEEDFAALERAEQAKSELPATAAAFETVRREMLEAIAVTPMGAREVREQLYMGVQVLERVRTALLNVASVADVSKHGELIRRIMAGEDED